MLNEMKSRFLSGKRILVILAMLLAMSANAQWVQMSNGMGNGYVYSFAISGNYIFAGTDTGGVYLSTNNGSSWTHTASINNSVYSLAITGSNIFAGDGGEVLLSTNNGISWTQTALHRPVISLAISGSNIFAGTHYPQYGEGVFLSTNNGTTWTQTALNDKNIYSLIISGSNIFAGTNQGIYFSTNNGTSWTQTGLNNQTVMSFVISGNNIFAGTWTSGVYLSTNNGTSWTQTALSNGSIYSLATLGNNLFAGGLYGVYLSTNNGTSWIAINQGFNADPFVHALLIANNYIFAGATNGVWRRPLSEVVSIQNISTETPSKYSLSQNYPNPFNPTTNIKFSIVNSGDVKLVVYDIQGREVQTLVNESLKPGTYEAAFDGSMLNSGVYFYKLITGTFSETKKMILIK
jgi:hypothetical protein